MVNFGGQTLEFLLAVQPATELNKDSVALPPLLTALDKDCFIEKISKLPKSVVDIVYEAVLESLKY